MWEPIYLFSNFHYIKIHIPKNIVKYVRKYLGRLNFVILLYTHEIFAASNNINEIFTSPR